MGKSGFHGAATARHLHAELAHTFALPVFLVALLWSVKHWVWSLTRNREARLHPITLLLCDRLGIPDSTGNLCLAWVENSHCALLLLGRKADQRALGLDLQLLMRRYSLLHKHRGFLAKDLVDVGLRGNQAPCLLVEISSVTRRPVRGLLCCVEVVFVARSGVQKSIDCVVAERVLLRGRALVEVIAGRDWTHKLLVVVTGWRDYQSALASSVLDLCERRERIVVSSTGDEAFWEVLSGSKRDVVVQ